MKRFFPWLLAGMTYALFAACATDGGDENILDTNLTNKPIESISLKEERRLVEYTFNDQKDQVEVFSCSQPNFTKTALINHDENHAFVAGKICSDWETQALANYGYNVVAINRPGYGASTGAKDFAGTMSQTAILAAIEDLKFIQTAPITTVWGYSTGSIAAAFVSKEIETAEYLILGNGIYDTETLAAKSIQDPLITTELNLALEQEGEDGHEFRSIEWDVDGLPKTIFLYHSELNPIVNFKRAESVRTTLAAAEFDVLLFPVKDGKKDIDWPTHQQVLRSILSKIK